MMEETLEKVMSDVAKVGSEVSVMEQARSFVPRLLPLQGGQFYEPPHEYRYGPDDRHKLDAYSPRGTGGECAPALLFHYGGYFARGSKQASPQVWANLASFFTARGFWVLVCDYRLVDHGARFPSGARDLARALTWVGDGHITELDCENIFLLGNSAGGINVCTYLYGDPTLRAPGVTLRGASLLSVPFQLSQEKFEAVPSVVTYYGDFASYTSNCPHKLLESAENPTRVPLLLLWATHDPVKEVLASLEPFCQEALKRGISVERFECVDHNHITAPLLLGLGQYDEWAEATFEWMTRLKSDCV